MINVGNLAEMGTNWIHEQQLQIDVPFNQVLSWLIFAVQDIQVFLAGKVVESILDDISINHFFVGLFDFHDGLFHLGLENLVKS